MKCPKCGKENTDNANICVYCGSRMTINLEKSIRPEAQETSTVPAQKPAYKAPAGQINPDTRGNIPPAQPIQDMDNIKYGGFWRRSVAFIIDYIILIVSFFVLFIFGIYLSTYDFIGILGLCMMILALIMLFLYAPIMESSKLQATVGKYAVDLKVVGKDGGRISFWRALGRYICRNIGMSIFYLGAIWIGFDSKKQGFHDHLVETLVVSRDTPETAITMVMAGSKTSKMASVLLLIICILVALVMVVIMAAVVAAFVFGISSSA